MRRGVIIFALLLLGGALLAWLMQQEQGYLLLAVGDTTIEMNLWAAVLVLIAIWLVIRLLVKLVRSLRVVGQWQSARHHRGRAQTAHGLLYFVEGRWDKARKLLLRSANRSEMPLVNYLAAANAAFEEGDTDTVHKLLARAEQLSEGGGFAIAITRARLHLKMASFEEALAILNRLYRHSPNHPYTLKLLEQAYRGLGDWDNLHALLNDLRRHKVYNKAELAEREVDIYAHLLEYRAQRAERSGSAADRDELLALWDGAPQHVKQSPSALLNFTRSLQQLGQSAQAEKLLRKSINQQWDDQLVRRYGLVVTDDTDKQLIVAEAWLRERPNNPELLLALGRLAQRVELWGKAKDYLESARSLSGNADVYAQLASLMVQMGDTDKSMEYYQKGLLQSTRSQALEPVTLALPDAADTVLATGR